MRGAHMMLLGTAPAGAGVTYATFDAAKKNATVTLSGGGLIATASASSAWQSNVCNAGRTSGKPQAEFTGPAGGNMLVGVYADTGSGTKIWQAATYLGESSFYGASTGYWQNGFIYRTFGAAIGVATYGTDRITVALDLDAGTQTASFYKAGVLIQSVNLPGGNTWCLAATVRSSAACTLNAGQTSLVHPVAGYESGWSV